MATHSLSQQTLATWFLTQSNELQKSAGQPKEKKKEKKINTNNLCKKNFGDMDWVYEL